MPAESEALRPAASAKFPALPPRALVVAIDGPGGSGKSTVAKGVARALGLRYLDTGAMYRALTWQVLRSGTSPDDGPAVAHAAAALELRISADPDHPTVEIADVDVSASIRTPEVTAAVSAVSRHPAVRELVVRRQQEIIGGGGVVVEGRDIGTVVCPDAPVKVFLTASADARARRRTRDFAVASLAVDAVRRELDRRDAVDSTRSASPLVKAADAVEVDSTDLDAAAVIACVLALIADRTGIRPVGPTA